MSPQHSKCFKSPIINQEATITKAFLNACLVKVITKPSTGHYAMLVLRCKVTIALTFCSSLKIRLLAMHACWSLHAYCWSLHAYIRCSLSLVFYCALVYKHLSDAKPLVFLFRRRIQQRFLTLAAWFASWFERYLFNFCYCTFFSLTSSCSGPSWRWCPSSSGSSGDVAVATGGVGPRNADAQKV